MRLGETHIPVCHDKTERLCVNALIFLLFLTTTVRCVVSGWVAKQQVQVASKEGAPKRGFFFFGNTEQGGANCDRKKKKRNRKRNQFVQRQIKSKKQTSHLCTLSDREQTKTGWVGRS